MQKYYEKKCCFEIFTAKFSHFFCQKTQFFTTKNILRKLHHIPTLLFFFGGGGGGKKIFPEPTVFRAKIC